MNQPDVPTPRLTRRLPSGGLEIIPLTIVHDYRPIQVGETVTSRVDRAPLVRGVTYTVMLAAGPGEDRVLWIRASPGGAAPIVCRQSEVLRADGLRRTA